MTRLSPSWILALALLLATGTHASAQTVAAPAGPGPEWIRLPDGLERARASKKKVLVDIWSARCGWCARMQREVYPQPELMTYLDEHFETVRLDIDLKTDTISYAGYTLSSADLSVGFGATGTPTTVFLQSDGTYITRLPGFHDLETFLGVLRFIGSDAYKTQTFEEYSAAQGAKTTKPGR